MKLTGAGANRPLEVELFVFGDALAAMDSLAVQVCMPVETAAAVNGQEWTRRSTDTIELSHAALSVLCAGTRVATRLTGTLAPAQMNKDLDIRWQPFKKTVGMLKYAPEDAAWRAALAATALLCCCALGFIWRWGAYHAPLRPALIAILIVEILAGIVWSCLPITPVAESVPGVIRRMEFRELEMMFAQGVYELKPEERSEASIRGKFPGWLKELRYYGDKNELREGDAPGNYQYRQLPDGNWQLIWIDDFGREMVSNEAEVNPQSDKGLPAQPLPAF